jgi:ClpP class serine protease
MMQVLPTSLPSLRWLLVCTTMSFLSIDATAAGLRVLGENKSAVIHLTGQITAQDYHRLDALIEQIERRNKGVEITLILDSPGGSHFAALRVCLGIHG